MGAGAGGASLPVKPRLVFVDGRDRIDAGCDCQAVIGGDGLVASIAAASIVAKVTRDRLMTCLGAAHPGYGFERHMGYSVPEHFAALDRLGPTIHHRRSFSPVAIALGELIAKPKIALPAYCLSSVSGLIAAPPFEERATEPDFADRIADPRRMHRAGPDVLRTPLH